MAIKDLQIRQGKVDLIIEVTEIGDTREFEKFGKQGRVCSAKAKDDTGEITLTLWNEQIDQVKVGNKVKITNGYVGEFQGEPQLTTGKFGKLEVVGEGAETVDEAEEAETLENKNTDKGEKVVTEDEKTEEESLDELKEEPIGDEEEIK